MIDRESGKSYRLFISENFREKIERQTQAGETLIDFSIQGIHINNQGSSICVVFEKMLRKHKRIHTSHSLITCFNIDKENVLSNSIDGARIA